MNYMLIFAFITGVTILLMLFKISRLDKRYLPLLIYVLLILTEIGVEYFIKLDLKRYVHLLYITEPFSMLYGLLIYIYARNQSRPKLYLKRFDLIFVIPFVLSVLSYLPFFILDAKNKFLVFNNSGNIRLDVIENVWEWNFEIVLSSVFLIYAFLELKKRNDKIKEQFSEISKVDLHVTRLIIKVCLVSYIFEFIFVYLTYFGFPYYSVLFDVFKFLNFGVLLFIGYDAYFSNKYIKELTSSWVDLPKAEIELDGQIVKYSKSVLSDETTEHIKKKLLLFMKENKPYLQPKLRIKDLSELIDEPSHHISQVINERFQQNFYDFINAYRIKMAKGLLVDPAYSKFTYTAIGFEVGFNSKSAFYAAFKKITGTTPGQFTV